MSAEWQFALMVAVVFTSSAALGTWMGARIGDRWKKEMDAASCEACSGVSVTVWHENGAKCPREGSKNG